MTGLDRILTTLSKKYARAREDNGGGFNLWRFMPETVVGSVFFVWPKLRELFLVKRLYELRGIDGQGNRGDLTGITVKQVAKDQLAHARE